MKPVKIPAWIIKEILLLDKELLTTDICLGESLFSSGMKPLRAYAPVAGPTCLHMLAELYGLWV